jgi:predicted nucleic acid-binding protein
MPALVVNASPLIVLAKVGWLRLLEAIGSPVLVPEAVVQEILDGPFDDQARKAMEDGWGERRTPRSIPEVILEWSLGSGETAVLALSLETDGALAVLDDVEARRCARTIGVASIGTLGIVLRSAMLGTIPSAGPVLRALKSAGLYLDDAVVSEALRQTTGESWSR